MTSHQARSRSHRRALGFLATAVSVAVGAVAFSPAAQAAEAGHRAPAASSAAGRVMHSETFTIPAGQATYHGANVTIARSVKQAATATTCAITISNPYSTGPDRIEALSQVQCSQSVAEIQLYAYLYAPSISSTPFGENYNSSTNSNFVQVYVDAITLYTTWYYAYAFGYAYLSSTSAIGLQDQSQEVYLN